VIDVDLGEVEDAGHVVQSPPEAAGLDEGVGAKVESMLRPMKQADFRYTERLRVRWAEVDLQRIVFNGHYLMYFDTAVAGWWRAMALPYHLTVASFEGDLYVRKATLEYEGSARYDDQLLVGVRCARIGNSSMTVQAAVFRAGQTLVQGELVYVFADPATQSSRPVPQRLRDVLLGFEAGEPTLVLVEGVDVAPGVADEPADGDEEGAALKPAVLANNAGAWHVAAHNPLGLTVASARLLSPVAGVARIDHLAVRASLQGSGIGRTIVQALARVAAQRGATCLQVAPPREAAAIFSRMGFVDSNADAQGVAGDTVQMKRVL
jgi:YbgC/YbaW family acyl-CoA thioester hydrolase